MQNKKYKNIVLDFAAKLNDVVFIGQAVFVIIVLLISWSSVKAIQSNYELQKQITALRQENEIQSLQNDNLNLTNNYFNSSQYLDLSARENFSLAAPNEKEIIVPQQVAMAHTANINISQDSSSKNVSKTTSNIDSWVNFFLGKNN